jgi:hydrogenase nickel incorporation protein HypA/HybF
MSIAESVLEAVRAEAERHRPARVARVGMKLGELSGVNADSLRFCFEILVQGSDLEPLGLDVELVPRTNRCGACGKEFTVAGYDFACTACGSPDTTPAGGSEMLLAYLELEDADASAPGT